MNILRTIKNDPFKILSYLSGRLCRLRLCFDRRIKVGTNLRIISRPIINIRGRCTITIGNNVLLNSRNRGYFAAIHSPVKLFVDSDGASITIGSNTRIHGSSIHAYESIKIGNNCLIAGNTLIVDSDGHDPFPDEITDRLVTRKEGKPVSIGDNVWIGANCTILKGVNIGEGSIIGAGAVVRQSIPPYSVAIGNPAVIVKKREKV
jgi:acetyltransferase-like isoleucine patch superfamily enzyme